MKATNWSTLKRVETIRLVQSMYIWLFLVPILVKFTNRIEDLISVTIFDYSFEIATGVPFSWQLFYFSAVGFVLGNLLVLIFCPRVIAENESYSSFVDQKKGRAHLYHYFNDIGDSGAKFSVLWDSDSLRSLPEEEKIRATEERKASVFWTIFNDAEVVRRHARVAAASFYAVAFGLIAFVLIQNLFFVLEQIFFQI
ncbi:MAG: hypothetical protein AAF270_05435 [Pseudomonadota bacterium]